MSDNQDQPDEYAPESYEDLLGYNEPESTDGKPKRRKLKIATNVVPMQIDYLGRQCWYSYTSPESYEVRAEARVPPALPGIIIFVHGVNSEGEWYDDAEEALCKGLNDRLGRPDLEANTYSSGSGVGESSVRQIIKMGNSPVIRFYWGYRAPDGEERKWRIPLRNDKGADQWQEADAKESKNPGRGIGAVARSRTARTTCNNCGAKAALTAIYWGYLICNGSTPNGIGS